MARDTPDKGLKARKRDELFDALAEVTAADPSVHGTRLSRVRKALLGADLPYTAADVHRLAEIMPLRYPSFKRSLTPEVVEKYIGEVRAPSPPPHGSNLEVQRGSYDPNKPPRRSARYRQGDSGV